MFPQQRKFVAIAVLMVAGITARPSALGYPMNVSRQPAPLSSRGRGKQISRQVATQLAS